MDIRVNNAAEREVFETVPAPRAVMTLAVPTIISQLVTVIYNLADTFFVGQMGDPLKVAAVSLAYPWFNILNAFGNLYGVGGGSLVSRMMGAGKSAEAKHVSAFSLCGVAATSLLYSIVTFVLMDPILKFLGASEYTIAYGRSYLLWVVVIGGIPTTLGLVLGHLLRSEGHARESSTGMMLGGILNVGLDPLFIFGLKMGVTGAAVATAISNCAGVVYLVLAIRRLRGRTVLSLNPANFVWRYSGDVFSVGAASFFAAGLASVSGMVIFGLMAGYGDVPVAAFGIVKKIDSIPFGFCMGLCQGFMPLIGYNYAAKNYSRMRQVSRFSWKIGFIFAGTCVAISWLLAPQIVGLFIGDAGTESLGAQFLRIACIAVPFTCVNFIISYTLQAMGIGRPAAILNSLRLGVINIPLLFLMNRLLGMYGMIWTQLISELLVLSASFIIYFKTVQRFESGAAAAQEDAERRPQDVIK